LKKKREGKKEEAGETMIDFTKDKSIHWSYFTPCCTGTFDWETR
jgi:hypothetical protein